MTTTTVRMTGGAYWAERGAGALDALAQEATKTGMDGVAAQLTRDAADCRAYLEKYGARDSLAGEMLEALKAVITGSTRVIGQDSTGQDVARIREASLERVRAVIAKVEGRADG